MLAIPAWIQLTKSRLKPYLRFFILGGTLFFLASTFRNHWQEVAAIRIDQAGWGYLVGALGVTLLAHIWSGWVWTWILGYLQQPIPLRWGLQVYLITNIAKYLPGNVWHFYGRIMAVKEAGVSVEAATLSVLLEPVLMAAAALGIALAGTPSNSLQTLGSLLGLGVILGVIHPRFLTPLMERVKRMKVKSTDALSAQSSQGIPLKHYPVWLLLGELGFLLFRGFGFLLAILAILPDSLQANLWTQLPLLFGTFSFAWLLGLVVPGAPGGMGVFEATAVALLGTHFSAGIILGAVACYRLISVLAEAAGALLGWVDRRLT